MSPPSAGSRLSLQWGRIVLGAFAMEIALIATAIPLFISGHGDANFYLIPPAAFALTYFVTLWIGRGFKNRFTLQGALVGVVGVVLYVALTSAQAEPWQYLLAHVLKVLGGAAGGRTLARRQAETAAKPITV